MLIEILSEDKSGAVVVERLAERIVENEGLDVEVNVHPHRGCGSLPKDMTAKPPKFASSLLDLLPSELRAYNKVYAGKDLILIIAMDSDDKDPQALRQEIYSVASKFAPDIRSVVGISTEEIEAWVLGDRNAILDAYPDCKKDILDSYEQDSVCGTWEILCKAISENADDLIEIGYPAIGHYKALWTETISRYMLPQHNVSPSFNTFKMALITALKNPVPIYRRREF
ncbi:MAG: hypothetical protein IKH82_07275 [Clostridiales bacterium]|nr:hypothetical protein [Clostridiales bacterium]MBR6987853.1 hypothetical protein [Clostridiales bacterium]